MTSSIPKEIKQSFLAFRNGIVADALRKAGMPYGIIFGLQLPQLSEIARAYEPDRELAEALWADTGVRESRLLAAWLYPPEALSPGRAAEMALGALTREEADILSFRLLLRHPQARAIADMIAAGASTPLQAYAAEALDRNLG